jgi:hypothetical protein
MFKKAFGKPPATYINDQLLATGEGRSLASVRPELA